jgi:hypothetical protein
MNAIRTRIAALIAGALIAGVTRLGFAELPPGFEETVAVWADQTLEVVLLLVYAVVHPWLQKRRHTAASPAAEPRAADARPVGGQL